MIPSLALLLASAAHGFCGAFVAGAGAQINSQTSQVVFVSQDSATTLTLAADYEGSSSEFGLLVPVPKNVTEASVSVLSHEVIERIDAYSAPRLVKYTCEDVVTQEQQDASFGCSYDKAVADSGGGDDGVLGDPSDDSVRVKAEFRAGEYQIAILAAQGAGGLQEWLVNNGYAIPAGGEAVIDQYLSDGNNFLAAKVVLDQAPQGRGWLSPIQIRQGVVRDGWSLPILLGTLNAQGQQDVLLYVIAAGTGVEIANYPEAHIEDVDCMVPRGEDFGAYYEELFAQAVAQKDGGAGWVQEYSWAPSKCDPCSPGDGKPLDNELLEAVGWTPTPGSTYGTYGYYTYYNDDSPHFTRLHMRYDPARVTQDLVLSATYSTTSQQMRFMSYEESLEFVLPVCGKGYVDDPGECRQKLRKSGTGEAAWLLLLPLLTLLRRRRGC
jgi:hypothetical protein